MTHQFRIRSKVIKQEYAVANEKKVYSLQQLEIITSRNIHRVGINVVPLYIYKPFNDLS